MKNPFRTMRRVALVVLLAGSVTGLALATEGAPASHAASYPAITATASSYQQIHVTGNGFSFGGSVVVEVYDAGYHLTNWQYTTASSTYCSRYYCVLGGYVNVTMDVTPCWQTDHVIAYDYNTSTWSNWSDVYVRCIP